MSRREKLRRKLWPHMRLEFRHAGAACPACGYVFNNGFSTYTKDHGPSSLGESGETYTPCTRCRKVLAVHMDSGAIRVLDETGLMLLTAGDREALAAVTELLDEYTRWWA